MTFIVNSDSTTKATAQSRNAGLWVEVDRSNEEPLPPVNEYDDRPATRDIIQQNSAMIQRIRNNLESDPLYDPIKHDDLWIVRYILSHKTVDKATKAAKRFLIYRKELRLDDADIRESPPGPNCHVDGVRNFYASITKGAMTFSHPDPDRGVTLFLHLAGVDQNKMANICDDDWPFWYFLEWMFQVLDSVTRRTGRLTKGIRLIDLNGYSMSQNNRECINRNSSNARECQDHYPQMLASVYVLNAPVWGSVIFRFVKPLLPKRFVAKFDMIDPESCEKDTKALFRHVSAEHLPMKLLRDLEQRPQATCISLYCGTMCSP